MTTALIEAESLLADCKKFANELNKIGAGASLLERAIPPRSVRSEINKREQDYGKELRALCVDIAARYLIIIKYQHRYFDGLIQNQTHRALWNNDIHDTALDYWCSFPRQQWLSNEGYLHPMPEDLKAKLKECLGKCPLLAQNLNLDFDKF